MLLGSTAASTGVVIAKVAPLLTRPPAVTVTLPVVASGGTVAVTDDDVLPVRVPGTRTLFAPAKVTVGALPKPELLIVTLLPIGPEPADRLLIVGGGGGDAGRELVRDLESAELRCALLGGYVGDRHIADSGRSAQGDIEGRRDLARA